MTKVRKPLAKDEEQWRELWKGYLNFYGVETLDPAVTARNWASLLDANGSIQGLIAVDDHDKPIGFAHYVLHPFTWGVGHSCYMEDLFVSQDVRGSGAGRALIDALMDLARDEGWARVYWHTHVENKTARRLYDRYIMADEFVRYRVVC